MPDVSGIFYSFHNGIYFKYGYAQYGKTFVFLSGKRDDK